MAFPDFSAMFKPAPAAPAQATTSAAVTATPSANPSTEAAATGSAQTQKSALDLYGEMFQNASKVSDIEAPSFQLKPEDVGKVASSMDFTRGISEESMTKALAGDAKSLVALMNSVGRNAYAASLEHTTTLTNAHLGQRSAFEQSRVDKGVHKKLTDSALSNTPNYSHPVVKAELNRVAEQISKANPDYTPQQVADTAQKYISDLSAALVPQQSAAEKQAASGETDWTAYLKADS
jgi:hypothetical protein